MKHRLLIYFFSCCCDSISHAQVPGLPFSKFYSSKEYQGGIQNFSITQSISGLIYVANNFGLLNMMELLGEDILCQIALKSEMYKLMKKESSM
jgi:hypothetical protein